MKVFNFSNKLKKLVTLIAITAIIVGCVQPTQAKASTKNNTKANTNANYTDEAYQSKQSTMLGVAADFGIFVQGELRTTAHSDSNFACGQLYLQNSITPKAADAINYAGEVLSGGRIDTGYLYVGKGKITRDSQYWKVDGKTVGEGSNTLKQALLAPSFMDLAKEFTKLTELADKMSKYDKQNTTYDFGDQNKREIACASDYNVLNLTYEDFMLTDRDLNIKNLRGDKLLIVNVNMSGYAKKEFTFSARIKLDNNLGNFDSDATNVIWNFNNYDGAITLGAGMAGVILAPKAKVRLDGGNHTGIIIGQSFSNNSEVHFVPFKYQDKRPEPVSVAIQSVDGNCCPSKPLGGVVFAVYTTDGTLVPGTERMVEADASGNFTTRWSIDKPGRYYIQETQIGSGYVKSPIKSRFDVKEVDKSLKLTMIKGKEANGYTSTIKNIDGEERFFIRHYSNEVFVVALDAKKLGMLYNTTFEVYKAGGQGDFTSGEMLTQGSADSDGYFTINIPEEGFYYVKQTATQDGYEISSEIKQFAVYTTPIGHQMVVELEDAAGLTVLTILQNHLGSTMKMTKLKAEMNKELIAFGYIKGEKTNDYDSVTDACIIYMN